MVFTHIERDRYADSLEILFAATVLNDQPGISQGYIGMAGDSFRETLREAGIDETALGAPPPPIWCCWPMLRMKRPLKPPSGKP